MNAAAVNVVLVHGANTDGSGWRGVHDILVKDGYHVSVVQQPLTGLDADVAATKRVIDQQQGPVILVGHSYGGTRRAGCNHARARRDCNGQSREARAQPA